MKSQETEQLLSHLDFLYPNQLSKKTSKERSGMIKSWTVFFKDFPFVVVLAAAQKTAINSPDFYPSAPKIYAQLQWATDMLLQKNDKDCIAWLEQCNLAIEQQKKVQEQEAHEAKSDIRLSKIKSTIELHVGMPWHKLLQDFYYQQQAIENSANEDVCCEHFKLVRERLLDDVLAQADEESRQEIYKRSEKAIQSAQRFASTSTKQYKISVQHRQTATYFNLIDLWGFDPQLPRWEMSNNYMKRLRQEQLKAGISYQMPALTD